jgi:hypothetical protein
MHNDQKMAEALANAATPWEMYEAEGAICERLAVSLSETELGFTPNAVALVETFVSDNLGRKWDYSLLPAEVVAG